MSVKISPALSSRGISHNRDISTPTAFLASAHRDPGGAKTGTFLPTRNAPETLALPGSCNIDVSHVDAATPRIFVAASDHGRLPPKGRRT